MAWTEAHVRRLFWRAGFGATPTEAARFAARGRRAAIDWLLYGDRGPKLTGPAPSVDGRPLDPENEGAHDVLWWLDRMVRSRRPLEEKLTLFWHDHFATNDQDTPLMLRQNRTFRKHALGNFRTLLQAVTRDPAMQFFLSLADNDKDAPNENYAREVMELFTLGSGYTERDIRQAARAFTGYRSYEGPGGVYLTRFDRSRHDRGMKRIFGARGRFDAWATLDLCLAHRRHAPFLVRKLWDYFVVPPPSRATLARLSRIYRRSGFEIKPLVRAILEHPALYRSLHAPDMVKSPIVLVAGALRTAGVPVRRAPWPGLLAGMGQYPFTPPSVAGWDWGPVWLQTNTMQARFACAGELLAERPIAVADGSGDPALAAPDALAAAEAATGYPWISPSTRAALLDLAAGFFDGLPPDDEPARKERADMLQRVLRHFLLAGPDAQLH